MPNFLDGQQNLAALSVPGVYGDIILPVPFLIGQPTNIMGLVGVASWGPLNSLIPVSKATDAFLQIGPPKVRNRDISSYVTAATQVGSVIGFMCVRVSDGTDVAATGTLQPGPTQAQGFITFTINPTNNSTITLGGTTVTFVTAAPVGNQVQIGANLSTTLASLLTFLQGSADVNLVKFYYALNGLTLQLTAVASGTSGNSLTVASTVTGSLVSGSTLSGGSTGNGATITAKYSGTMGNQIQCSIQNSLLANTLQAVISFPGLPPEQILNVPTGNTNATGTVTFTVNPTNSQTLTLNGVTVTFVSSGATGNQVNIGNSLAVTLQNLVNVLNATTDPTIGLCSYVVSPTTFILNITVKQAGGQGNSFSLATNVTGATVSGAALTGGTFGGNAFWVNLVNAINSGNPYHGPSQFVVATVGTSTAFPTLSAPIILTGGTDGDNGVTDAILVGQDILPRKGMFAFRNSIIDSFTLCDLQTISYYAAIASFSIQEGFLAVFGTTSGDTINNALATRINSGADTPWLWLIMGDWPSYYDSYNQVVRTINPSAFGLGIIGNLSPQQSPLNKPLQGITSTQRSAVGTTYSDTELSLINLGGIDTILAPVQSPGGFYFSFATGRNVSSNTAANGIEYTRMTNFLMRTAQSKAAGSFVGRLQSIQPNDQTRSDAKALFDGLSAQLASPQFGLGINGQGMIDKPWLVTCDLTNNPPATQALGFLFLYWQVRYLNVVRYFVIKFQGGGNVTINVQNNAPSPVQFATQANGLVG